MASSNAAPTAVALAEIKYLLSTVANSGCEFYRNGTWYDAKAAAAHLRYKYEYLVAKDLILDTTDFIDKAGSKSSFSGRAYAIRCDGSPEVSSHDWLTNLLVHYRQSQKTGP